MPALVNELAFLSLTLGFDLLPYEALSEKLGLFFEDLRNKIK
jgi:hypothetical protein